jgi:hypothetical protein
VFSSIDEYLLPKGMGVVVTEFGSDASMYSHEERLAHAKANIPRFTERNIPVTWFSGVILEEDYSDFSLYNNYTFKPIHPDLIKILTGK